MQFRLPLSLLCMLRSASNIRGKDAANFLEGIHHVGQRGTREEAGHSSGPGGGRAQQRTERRRWRQVEAVVAWEEEAFPPLVPAAAPAHT
jgi:hypothetical protein